MEKAYQDGKIEYDDLVFLDDKLTTYGRRKIELIINDRSLNSLLDTPNKKDVPIDSKNIGKLISVIGNDRNRAQEVNQLNLFASEIITHHGMDTPPFEEIYDFNDPEVIKLINSNEKPEIKYTELNNLIKSQVKKTIENLPDSNLNDMLAGSKRVKMGSLQDIYCPVVYGDGTVSSSTLFSGFTERDFVTKGLENRKVQQVKKAGTPISGFLSRQMILSNMDLKYVDKDESPDTTGLMIPRSEAIGRTMMDGRKVRGFSSSKEMVRVKSCINHDFDVVFRDEINQDELRETDGASIGISFAMSFTEAMTQSVLALKYGASKSFENASAHAQRAGTVNSIDRDFLTIVTSDNKVDKYLLSGVIALPSDIKVGNYVNTGDLLIQSRRLSQLYDQVADFSDFFGLQNSSAKEGMGREAGRGKVVCYAPKDGVISYPTPYTIKIDDVEIPVNRKELYYYPEGYRVKKGERFCSGLLDLHAFYSLNGRTQDTFDAMKKSLYEINNKTYVMEGDDWTNETRSELLEVMYKSLVGFQFKARRKYTQTENFLERMDYGDGKRGLAGFFKKSENNVIPIQDSVIMPMVLGFKTLEK